jgi:methionyl aminopeptidase
MSIGSREDLDGLRAAGRVVGLAIAAMRERLRPGVTTAELDAVAAEAFAREGARSAPQIVYGFPGVTCISVNDEAVHGVPGGRRIEPGDVVTLDVTAEVDGYIADAAVTVGVDPVATRDRARRASTRCWRTSSALERAGAGDRCGRRATGRPGRVQRPTVAHRTWSRPGDPRATNGA